MNTRFLMRRTLLVALLATGVGASTCTLTRAQDAAPAATANELIPLRAKWTAGEKLSYEVRVDGTVNMQTSRNRPSPFAGVPLDIDMKMLGATTLETLKVDEMGNGTVAMSLDNMRILAQTFGVKADFTIRDGETIFLFNGKRMGAQRPAGNNKPNTPKKMQAPFALEISDRGRILKAVPNEKESTGDAAQAGAKPGASPFDFNQMAESVFWRVIPALWPAQPVKVGDKWAADVTWPPPGVPAVQADAAAAPPAQLGHFDFQLKGSENVAGRRVLRVGIDGKVEIDEDQSRNLSLSVQGEADKRAAEAEAKAAGARAALPARPPFNTQLTGAAQKIIGDIWVDADKGQIVRAELNLEAQTSAHDVPTNDRAKIKDGDSWLDFAGTVQLQLKPPTATPVVMP